MADEKRESETLKEYNARKQREWREKNRERAREADRKNAKKRRKVSRDSTCIYFGAERLAKLTRDQMAGAFDNLSAAVCGAVDVAGELTAKEVHAFLNDCREAGKSPGQVLRELARVAVS